jgi:hypothetical protein
MEHGSKITQTDMEFFGSESRCIETDLQRPMCLKFDCDTRRRKAVIYVKNGNSFDPIVCENDGDLMKIPGLQQGNVVCPSLDMVCPE